MKKITQEEASSYSVLPLNGKVSPNREALEKMEIGEIALFQKGEDYSEYKTMRSTIYNATLRTNGKFERRQLKDRSGVIVKRVG